MNDPKVDSNLGTVLDPVEASVVEVLLESLSVSEPQKVWELIG